MPRPFLTIGIPTYNRFESVRSRVREYVDHGFGPEISLMVVDNASSDASYQRLREEFEGSGVALFENSENVGYGGNFIRLFELVESDYLMIVSDEDQIVAKGIEAAVAYCRANRPAFVSPQADVRGNAMYRGRDVSRLVEPHEFKQSAFYLSGLTFAIPALRDDVVEIGALMQSNSAAAIYPQVLVAAAATARREAHFLAERMTVQVDHHPTSITERAGGIYNMVTGRWLQSVGYEQFFADRLTRALPNEQERYRVMRDSVRAEALETLLIAMRREQPELADAVELSMTRHVRRHRPAARLLRAFRSAVARLRGRR